jgi:hypothetical protein
MEIIFPFTAKFFLPIFVAVESQERPGLVGL